MHQKGLKELTTHWVWSEKVLVQEKVKEHFLKHDPVLSIDVKSLFR